VAATGSYYSQACRSRRCFAVDRVSAGWSPASANTAVARAFSMERT
jgi:hypothetical protein